MLFAQIAPAAAPTTEAPAEVRDKDAPPAAPSGATPAPTQPTAPSVPETPAAPQETRTTRPAVATPPEGRLPIDDPRSTRDESYDPLGLPLRDPRERPPTTGFGAAGPLGGGVDPGAVDQEGAPLRAGGDTLLQMSLLEGYNSNVVQTQAIVGGPATRHPSPFTGGDVLFELVSVARPENVNVLRLELRGQHYTPLEHFSQPDDGSALAAYEGNFALGRTSLVEARFASTISTLNSGRLSDGALFQVDPTNLQRIFTLTTARVSLEHEFSERTRIRVGVDALASTTVRDQPAVLPDGGLLAHHGLDYVTFGADATLFHDFSDTNSGRVRLRYEPTYTAYLLDFSDPTRPVAIGHATTHIVSGTIGSTHAFSESCRALTDVGLTYATAPPVDPDRRPILSPAATEEVVYQTQFWLASASLGYTYGSANPRLGFGPSASVGGAIEGTPLPYGRFRKLGILANVIATRAAFRESATSLSRLSFAQAGVEFRYAIDPHFGLLGGYSYRYALFEGLDPLPSLTRHVVFFGVSGYFATNRTLPLLTTFAPPLSGG